MHVTYTMYSLLTMLHSGDVTLIPSYVWEVFGEKRICEPFLQGDRNYKSLIDSREITLKCPAIDIDIEGIWKVIDDMALQPPCSRAKDVGYIVRGMGTGKTRLL